MPIRQLIKKVPDKPKPKRESEKKRHERRVRIFGERGARVRETFLRPLKKRNK